MSDYRLYFIDDSAAILARDEFRCDSDAIALLIAASLFSACSEAYSAYELWSGRRRITPLGGKRVNGEAQSADEMGASAEDIVIEREQVLLRSAWTVAKSQRLLEAMTGLAERRRNRALS